MIKHIYSLSFHSVIINTPSIHMVLQRDVCSMTDTF